MCKFIYSFNIMYAYYVPVTFRSRDTSVNKIKEDNPCLHEAYILLGDNKHNKANFIVL